jgi:hypothetical protein
MNSLLTLVVMDVIDDYSIYPNPVGYKKEKKFHIKPVIIDNKKYFLEYSYSVTKNYVEGADDCNDPQCIGGHKSVTKTFYVAKRLYNQYDAETLWKLYDKSGFLINHRK